MSDTGPIPPAHRNAMIPDTHTGVIGAVSDLGQKLVTALPPAFVMLCLVNALFIFAILWFLDDQLDQRTKLVNTLVDRCMDIALKAGGG